MQINKTIRDFWQSFDGTVIGVFVATFTVACVLLSITLHKQMTPADWWSVSYTELTSANTQITVTNHTTDPDFTYTVVNAADETLTSASFEVLPSTTQTISIPEIAQQKNITIHVMHADETRILGK